MCDHVWNLQYYTVTIPIIVKYVWSSVESTVLYSTYNNHVCIIDQESKPKRHYRCKSREYHQHRHGRVVWMWKTWLVPLVSRNLRMGGFSISV